MVLPVALAAGLVVFLLVRGNGGGDEPVKTSQTSAAPRTVTSGGQQSPGSTAAGEGSSPAAGQPGTGRAGSGVTGGAPEPGGADNASTTIPAGGSSGGTTATTPPAPESTDGAAAGLPRDVIDQICSLIRSVVPGPVRRGDPLYQPELDPDGNGVACD